MAAGVHHIRVLVSSPGQLVARCGDLVTRVSAAPASAARVLVSLQPSLLAQLRPDTLDTWARACRLLYTRVPAQRDLCLAFTSLDSLPVDEEVRLGGGEGGEAGPAPGRVYSHVVLGGTFDRIHPGHKILLSAALLRCDTRITVGVTSPALLTKKLLPELIQPVEERIQSVDTFISQVRPDIERNVVKIDDPYGPAITGADMQCIVASSETEAGCVRINEKRREAGLPELDIHLIELAEDTERQLRVEEDKISSSSARIRLLGTRLRPPRRAWARDQGPYIIGLTGGSASGKSSVGRRVAGRGWGVVDCDKLGHLAYSPGQPAHAKVVQEFGQGVLAEDGTIDRRALGSIVFGDQARLAALNTIVWPEISRLALAQAAQLWREAGRQVVVLDAAVLLEAGWEAACHEVWVCVVPRHEAVRRIVARDGKTEQEAERRLDSQLGAGARVGAASTVICTLWEEDITQAQVTRAVERVNTELGL